MSRVTGRLIDFDRIPFRGRTIHFLVLLGSLRQVFFTPPPLLYLFYASIFSTQKNIFVDCILPFSFSNPCCRPCEWNSLLHVQCQIFQPHSDQTTIYYIPGVEQGWGEILTLRMVCVKIELHLVSKKWNFLSVELKGNKNVQSCLRLFDNIQKICYVTSITIHWYNLFIWKKNMFEKFFQFCNLWQAKFLQ